MQNWKISLMACFDTACMWTDEEGLQCEFFHIYVICMCRLRNHLITLRWDAIAASNYTSRTLKMEKKGKNGTQFVFCKCIIRFFLSCAKTTLEIDLAEGFQMIHVNGRRHFFCGSHVNFLGKPWKYFWHVAVSARKVDF